MYAMSVARKSKSLQRADIQVDAVFDIETAHWDEFVVGAIRRADGSLDVFDWKHEEKLVNAILTSGNIWAHNGGRFDTKWLADWMKRLGPAFELIPSGGSIAILKAPAQDFMPKLRVFDSYALSKQPLAKLTAGLGVSKAGFPLPCLRLGDCAVEPCEGYCAISRKLYPQDLRRVVEYLRADVESLWQALEALRTFAGKNDLDLGPTIGSAAYKTVRRWTGLPNSDLSEGDARYIRKAYFGGRVQRFRCDIVPVVYEYDVNSMYPAMLCQPVPVGERAYWWGRDAMARYGENAPGIYTALVEVPPMHIPPLPVRNKNRVGYPDRSVYRGVDLARARLCGEHRGQGVGGAPVLDLEQRPACLSRVGAPTFQGPLGCSRWEEWPARDFRQIRPEFGHWQARGQDRKRAHLRRAGTSRAD